MTSAAPQLSPPSPRTVSVLLLRALLDGAQRAGVEPERLLDAIGVPRTVADDVHGWIGVDAMTKAWVLAPDMSGDVDFGLHAAESAPTGIYGVLEFATISSPTLFEALKRVARYYRVLGAMSELGFVAEPTQVRIVLRPVVPTPAARLRHYAENIFAMLVSRARLLVSGGDVIPSEVRFAHPEPASTANHARIFRAPIRFDCAVNELVVPRAALDVPLRTANPVLSVVLEETGTAVLTRRDEDLVERVRRALAQAIQTGDTRLSTVGRALGIGTRTLQRKLRDAGASYAEILDDARRDLARRHVAEGKMSVGEIAFLLGFSQPSAFHRAFKRWTGTTPRGYRHACRVDGTAGQRNDGP